MLDKTDEKGCFVTALVDVITLAAEDALKAQQERWSIHLK